MKVFKGTDLDFNVTATREPDADLFRIRVMLGQYYATFTVPHMELTNGYSKESIEKYEKAKEAILKEMENDSENVKVIE